MNIDIYIAVTGFLLLLCVFANKLSDRFGIPSLLLFLALGMMAGIDGPGGINFQDSRLTNYIGTIALMFILFNGGLLTNWNSVRNELFRGTLLATVGVFLTALFLFLPAYYLLRLPLEISLLLSVIVSSTDAPAVFAAMRTSKIRISPKLKSLLEFESASNDPMAVFLSMAALAYLTQPEMQVGELGSFFVRQMSVGIIFGMALGRIAVHILAKIALALSRTLSRLWHQYRLSDLQPDPAVRRQRNFGGLHLRHHHRQQCFYVPPSSHPLLRFAGLDNANRNVPDFRPAGQSHELIAVVPVGVACTMLLMFIARPLAVFICLFKSNFTYSEQTLISWAGFKGAVPIILATYPLMAKIPDAPYIFNLIFFLVIISVLFQGKTLPGSGSASAFGNPVPKETPECQKHLKISIFSVTESVL